jgi:endogenous inhibitor of DNA gyrase (YacG/DUF329 family)
MPKPEQAPNSADRPEKAKPVCPICGRPRDPRYDPFCSKRCADVDLHRWLKGGYVIPGGEPGPREDDEQS